MLIRNNSYLRKWLADDIHPAIQALAGQMEFEIRDVDFQRFYAEIEKQQLAIHDVRHRIPQDEWEDKAVFHCLTHPDSGSLHYSPELPKAPFVVPPEPMRLDDPNLQYLLISSLTTNGLLLILFLYVLTRI